tara:strand:- start:253 stop:600 length:348 start_codon:yes stop_codon:yes gene_type:complete
MDKRLYILFSIFIYFYSCSSSNKQQKPIPECLKVTVDAILSKPVQTPKADIEKREYKGEEVYVVRGQNFPDGQTFIIPLDCSTTICTLGGFDGPDNDCPDWQDSKFIETVWTDPR